MKYPMGRIFAGSMIDIKFDLPSAAAPRTKGEQVMHINELFTAVDKA